MRIERFAQLSIRGKLLALVLLPLFVVLPLLGVGLLLWTSVALDRLLITKVRSDLAVAHGYFERVLGEVAASTASAADSHALQRVIAAGDEHALVTLLRTVKQRGALDFVNLRDADGRLRATDHGLAAGGDDDAPLRATPAAAGAQATIEILAPGAVARLAPALQSRVPVPLLPTRNAVATDRTVEDRAMVVLASVPVRAADGRVRGWVQGGVLLNRNLGFIDHINEIVYPPGSLPFGSQGTATLFLDDVRISTNVRLFDPDAVGEGSDSRAIGTRVSREVRDAVLDRGSTWLDRAFVVSDWYVSAYEPVVDGDGRRVGMLYVGFLEAPFTWVKFGALAVIGVVFFAVMIGAAMVSLRWARAIFAPVERMARTMQAVEAGRGDARVGAVAGGDEIARLAGHLDHLLDTVDANTRELQRFNAELDAKVAERTRDLQAAQQQLVRSEKLAAVGQLTASVAHEINNPIAVMQGNLDLLRELLGPAAVERVRAELKLLDEQVERMRLIVTQLLQFARPAEFAGYVDAVDTARVIEDCLVLVGPQLAKSGIAVRRDFAATRRPSINRHELQQVLVNLLVNAVHAMPDGGELTLATCDAGDDAVEIEVADTGPGLGPELIEELFKPFVTRKKDGTGLGLWISRSIVERYGGDLRAADCGPGRRGAVFTVVLRLEPETETA
jgi:signal transduction histidine kinase